MNWFNSFLKLLLLVNYSLSVRLKDYRESEYSSSCVRITSSEIFFILTAILSLSFPKSKSSEDLILFFAFSFISLIVAYFFLGEFFFRKIEDLKIRIEFRKLSEAGREPTYFGLGLFFFIFLLLAFSALLALRFL